MPDYLSVLLVGPLFLFHDWGQSAQVKISLELGGRGNFGLFFAPSCALGVQTVEHA